MATFPYSPDWGCKPTMTPRVNKCQFGDGYDQRSGDGLNTRLPVWPLTFSIRTQTEAQAIAAWLATNNADVTPFDWGGISGGVATSEWFGTGNGTQTTFQLLHGGSPVTSIVGTPTIFRTDWQGTQLLYSTARTNYSQGLSQWSLNAASIAGGHPSPDGSSGAYFLSDTTTSDQHFVSFASGLSSGTTVTLSCFAKAGTCSTLALSTWSGIDTVFDLVGGTISSMGSAISASITPLGGGWFRCVRTSVMSTSSICYVAPISTNIYTGTGAGVYVFGAQIETAPAPTPYIPTTTAPVTVTDYTLNGTGLVTLAVAPVSGATLTWSGNYTRKYIADEWTPATADDWGSWSVTAKFRQVPA